ncbi:dynamin family protein [Paenibacillus sp. B01]|uniref:dynamin family protein n=2 Tax=Paenibacillus TaxID=44249 RepID=UPI00129ADB50|nr:dynamin family protein [Paenibacillus sp. B01]QGG56180.1 dynamin [Paenibacillus sp. B01]
MAQGETATMSSGQEEAKRLGYSAERLAVLLAEQGEKELAGRARQLEEKLEAGRLSVAFCGHFSAGKSTLVNALCGVRLLPSSPIPTSANVVTIASGEPARAVIHAVVDGEERTIEADPLRLEDYCKNGEVFRSVDLTYPASGFGWQTTLLDTPGIDSTDDAHRMATESALHLADVVFYVMDYNHVQSEINFEFAKGLKDWGKPLYLIVNQIDKHREEELPFAEYKRSVEEAFRSWHLEPAGTLYLSLREPEHPQSQFEELKKLLGELEGLRSELAVGSVHASLRHLARSWLKHRLEAEEPQRERLELEAGPEEERAGLQAAMRELEQAAGGAESGPQALEASLQAEIGKILDNANLMPAATRDIAASFLESRKPGFKTGLLFAASKTAAEQERRAAAFEEELGRQVQAEAAWHLADLLRKAADREGLQGPERQSWESGLEAALAWRPDAAWLAERVSSGAVFGGEYTIVYCRDAAAQIKAQLKRGAFEAAAALATAARPRYAAAAAAARAELAALGGQAAALAGLAALGEAAAQREARALALLPAEPARPALPAPQARAAAAAGAAGSAPAAPEPALAGEAAPAPAAAGSRRAGTAAGEAAAGALAPQRAAAARLRAAAELLAPEPALAAAAAAMRARAERLGASRFTIALFGAFSAGKSSLANALIGERALPVSPNPTTAAINRILAPTEEQPHGTARVSMKAREAMLDDLRFSLSLLGEDASGAAEAELLKRIAALRPDGIHAAGRPHYSFLKAAAAGWSELSPQLGEVLRVGEEDYRRYVAEESRSCFVREIELFYSSPLTDQGIVLVDTPGADSVNARHTGVAFNYIKNADAILFVTYYNHAFSQADRQFLMQLGRVKDQFELDKMFFLVNAADLAASPEELGDVLKHVESNLLQHGIRFPRLFPVSSLLGLKGKHGDEAALAASGIPAFEQSFLDFTRGELGRLAVQAADGELERAAHTIRGWIEAAEGDADTRRHERARLEGLRAAGADAAAVIAEAPPAAELEKELQELFHYIQQRIRYGFGDFFNYAFNPSSLQDDGRDLRRAVWTSWLELQRLLQLELSQELLATTLRLETASGALIRVRAEAAAARLAELLPGFQPAPWEAAAFAAPPEPAPWQSAGVQAKRLYSLFRSPRSFFEGEGKKALREELEETIAPEIRAWMDHAAADWLAHYRTALEAGLAAAADALGLSFQRELDGRIGSMRDGGSLDSLRALERQLQELLGEAG